MQVNRKKCQGWIYQNTSLDHVHGGVCEDLFLKDAHGELAENARRAGLDRCLELRDQNN